jgi:protein-L-isoaspartate(D-aspartate) O-methyltransferase
MIRLRMADNGEMAAARHRLVRRIEREGIVDARVLMALASVPREAFVPEKLREFAYRDAPLPIGGGQTISQPSTVALMVEALELEATDRVLEVGAGSGYAAAVIGQIADEVFAIERLPELAAAARERLAALGVDNVEVYEGDGTEGLAAEAPFDAIVVAAGGPKAPGALLGQLRVGGRMVIPIGASVDEQKLFRIRRAGEEEYRQEELADVRFVPLVGRAGWDGGGE